MGRGHGAGPQRLTVPPRITISLSVSRLPWCSRAIPRTNTRGEKKKKKKGKKKKKKKVAAVFHAELQRLVLHGKLSPPLAPPS